MILKIYLNKDSLLIQNYFYIIESITLSLVAFKLDTNLELPVYFKVNFKLI